MLRPLTDGVPDAGSEPEAGLGDDQRLSADQHDHQHDRKPKQSDGEADRQLVQADADAKPDGGKPARPRQESHALRVVPVVGSRPEHEDAQRDENRDRDVVGGVSSNGSGASSQHDAHDRHAHLEERKKHRHPDPVAPREAAHAKRRGHGKRIQSQGDHQGDERKPHRA